MLGELHCASPLSPSSGHTADSDGSGILTIFNRTMELKKDTIVVVLGASGDLAKKKTVRHSNSRPPLIFETNYPSQFPALFGLVCRRLACANNQI